MFVGSTEQLRNSLEEVGKRGCITTLNVCRAASLELGRLEDKVADLRVEVARLREERASHVEGN